MQRKRSAHAGIIEKERQKRVLAAAAAATAAEGKSTGAGAAQQTLEAQMLEMHQRPLAHAVVTCAVDWVHWRCCMGPNSNEA